MKELDESIEWIRKNLVKNRETNPERVSFYNSIIPGCRNPLVVKTPVLAKISNEFWKDNKDDLDFILQVCDILWIKNTYYEEKKVVIFLLEKLVKKHPKDVLLKIEEYYPDLYTWDLVDQFGMRLCSELVKRNFSNFKIFSQWAMSSEFWIRRLSLVSLVRLRNNQLSFDQWSEIEPMLEMLWEDEEYYVHKAMSWCLRELSKSNSDKVISFLTNNLVQKADIKHVNGTFVKGCVKKLPTNEQSKILSLL